MAMFEMQIEHRGLVLHKLFLNQLALLTNGKALEAQHDTVHARWHAQHTLYGHRRFSSILIILAALIKSSNPHILRSQLQKKIISWTSFTTHGIVTSNCVNTKIFGQWSFAI